MSVVQGPWLGTQDVAWAPNAGSQRAFLSCPLLELMYSGSRGLGKTEPLLMDFAQHVGKGFGHWWRGILFRREYKHLDDVIVKSTRLFRRIWPGARFLRSKSDYKWVWPSGEELLFRVIKDDDDYWNFHGHEYPWIGFDELTNWPTPYLYEQMSTLCRSSAPFPNMPRKIRGTTNPWGAGHAWVKFRFVDQAPAGRIINDRSGLRRAWVHGTVHENKHLLAVDPDYINRLMALKNVELRKAWLYGDWSVNPGGFLAGVWDAQKHVIDPHPIPMHWTRWRALDWGFARPFSIGWYAKDPEGVVVRYRELYGWNGNPNEGARTDATAVAKVIKQIEAKEVKQGVKFRRNPADSAMWAEMGMAVAGKQVTPASLFHDEGVEWMRAEKGPGSRRAGASVVVDALNNDSFYVWKNCRHFLRTVPSLSPDPDDWEDVDTDQEDHVWDELRYSLTAHQPAARKRLRKRTPLVGTMDWVLMQQPRRAA